MRDATARTSRSERGSTVATRRACSRPRRESSSRRSWRIHLLEDDDGRWRYLYCQSTVVAAYGEMTRQPPPFEQVRIPTLLVLGETSYLPYDDLLGAHQEALGELLEVARIPAGHTVLWDALDDTAGAVERFLA
jgi:hypothetical protein